jgi:hypothetical protein
MRFLKTTVAVLTVTVLCVNAQRAQDASGQTVAKEPPKSVELCNLIARPRLYDGHLLHLKATYFVSFESSYLYDPDCNRKGDWLWLSLDCRNDDECKPMQDRLTRGVRGDPFGGSRAHVTAVGRFKLYKKGESRPRGFRFAFYASEIKEVVPPGDSH